MNEAWIIDTCRTPRGIGKRGKVLVEAVRNRFVDWIEAQRQVGWA